MDFDQLLDFVGDLLRIYGTESFDLGPERTKENIREHFSLLAGHLVLGTPYPGDIEKISYKLSERKYKKIRSDFFEYRKLEKEHVQNTISVQTEIIWGFIQKIGQGLVQDNEGNEVIAGQLSKLLQTTSNGDIQKLKMVAEESVSLISETLKKRYERNNHYLNDLGKKVGRLHSELTQIKREVAIDPLTKVFNRKGFDQKIQEIIDLNQLGAIEAHLFFFDLDHFKSINDQFGHQVGDETLKLAADCLSKIFRRRQDFVARYGGDEFTAIITECNDNEAETLGKRILETFVKSPSKVEGVKHGLSIGITPITASDNVESWIKRADSALYLAKERGRAQVVLLPVE